MIYLLILLVIVGVALRPGRIFFGFCGGPFCGPRPPRGPHGPFGGGSFGGGGFRGGGFGGGGFGGGMGRGGGAGRR